VETAAGGASGSYIGHNKLSCLREADHDSCGTYPFRGTLKIPDKLAVRQWLPSFTVALVEVNDGTFGKNA